MKKLSLLFLMYFLIIPVGAFALVSGEALCQAQLCHVFEVQMPD